MPEFIETLETDSDGETSTSVTAGEYELESSSDGYSDGSTTVVVDENTSATIEIESEEEPPDPGEDHAEWVDTPYLDQLDIPWVGPHPIDTEWVGYSPRPERSDADVTTDSLSSFFSEIDDAEVGDVVWLDEGEYQVDDEDERQDIPDGVTAASDGALIYSEDEHDGVFDVSSEGARITGFRFEGSQETGDHDTQSVGVFLRGDGEVDNCEFSEWMSMGVYVSGDDGVAEPHIHHCNFFDNRTDSMGYGVAAYGDSDPEIEYCFFNNNRHGIAGNGADSSSYRPEHNLHGEDGMLFQFEQHEDGGGRMDVRNNEFRMLEQESGEPARAYAQRGTPDDVATIENNWIYNPEDPEEEGPGGDAGISQTNHDSDDWDNVEFSGNHYGTDEPSSSDVGIQPLSTPGDETFSVTLSVSSDELGDLPDATISISRTGDVAETFDMTFVVEDSTGSPIEGAEVLDEATDETLETDSDGEVTFDGVIAGEYPYAVMADGYESGAGSVSVINEDVTETVTLTAEDAADYEVEMSDGVSAINSALESASPGEKVYVAGDGDHSDDFDDVVWLQEGVEIEYSNDIFVSVSDANGIDPVTISGEPIYCLMTNDDRSGVGDITVRGGEFELYDWDGQTEAYGGVWLHECWDFEIDDMDISGAGGADDHPSYGHADYRSGCVILTNCEGDGRNSDAPHVHDCELHDAGYDGLLMRGSNDGLWIRHNTAYGSSSGSIQTARWGVWGLTGYPGENYFDENDGRRIYDHDGDIIHMEGNESPYRLQTLGSREAYISGSYGFEGKVLLYCLDSGSEYQLVEDMEFVDAGEQPIAIQIGNNGGHTMDEIQVDDIWAERPTFLHFEDYSSSGEATLVEVHDSEVYGAGSGEIVSKDGGMSVNTLAFYDCEFDDFDSGIVGTYDTVIVEGCTFNGLSESEAINVDANNLETSDNNFA